MKKKVFSMLLSLVMLLTVFPAQASAATAFANETTSGTTSTSPDRTLTVYHQPHILEGEADITDLIGATPGLLSFKTGKAAVTGKGATKVKEWSVVGSGKVSFTFSKATEGDTVTLPITVYTEKLGTVTIDVIIKLEYQKLTITSADTVVYGSTLKLTCAGQKGKGAVFYSIVSEGNVATISGDVLTPLTTGTVTVRAVQVASGSEEAQTSEGAVITITKATPTGKPSYTKLTHAGQTLADAVLKQSGFSVPGTVEWVLPDDTVVVANTEYEWKFIPQDTANYKSITGTAIPYTVDNDVFTGSEGTTVLNKDGSHTTTSFGEDDSTYILTEYPDGSRRMVHKHLDGTVTTTTEDADGTYTNKIERPDRSSEITSRHTSGINHTTVTDKYGYTKVQVSIPSYVVRNAVKNDEIIDIPMPEIPRVDDRDDAPTVTFSFSASSPVRVGIPINSPSAGTVAVTVAKNGKETIVKTSTTGKDRLYVTLSGSTTVKVFDNSRSFLDVGDLHWCKSAADFVTSRGLFQGVDAVTFAPSATMSRAMLVTVLHNLEDNPYYGFYYGHLSDIEGKWYESAAAWAVANGHIGGFPDGTFQGDKEITREQLAVILYRYAGYPSSSGYVNSSFTSYRDYDTVSPYAYQAMYWAVSSGVLHTDGRDYLSPQHPATRAEVARTMQNLVEFLAG